MQFQSMFNIYRSFMFQENTTRKQVLTYLLGRRIGVVSGLESSCALFRCSCGYKFYAYLSDYWRFINSSLHYEPLTTSFLMRSVTKEDVILDVGAHIGIHTVHLAKRGKFVIAVEPEPHNLSLLKKNIENQGVYDKVVILPFAVCDYNGESLLYLHGSSGGHSLRPIGSRAIKVECRRLDSTLNTMGIDKVDVVKIDVEGFEEKVLAGLKGVFYLNPPRILVVEVDINSPIIESIKKHYLYNNVIVLDKWGKRLNMAFVRGS